MKNLKEALHEIISEYISDKSTVLDLGCGNGVLLKHLVDTKEVICHGIEIKTDAIISAIEKGISVIQWDLNKLPLDFPDNAFDFVTMQQAIQEIKEPKKLILEMLRIGKEVIMSFPNFGNINIRGKFFFTGQMPITDELPNKWYDTPNIHLLTVKDFEGFCDDYGIRIIRKIFLKRDRMTKKYKRIKALSNMRADVAVYKIRLKSKG